MCCFSIGFVFCIVQFFLPRVMNVLSASSRSSMVAWNKIACQARNKNPFKLHNPSQDTPWVLRLIWFYEVRIVEKRGWDHPKRLPPLVLVTSWGESLIRIMECGGGGRMKGEGVEAEVGGYLFIDGLPWAVHVEPGVANLQGGSKLNWLQS